MDSFETVTKPMLDFYPKDSDYAPGKIKQGPPGKSENWKCDPHPADGKPNLGLPPLAPARSPFPPSR